MPIQKKALKEEKAEEFDLVGFLFYQDNCGYHWEHVLLNNKTDYKNSDLVQAFKDMGGEENLVKVLATFPDSGKKLVGGIEYRIDTLVYSSQGQPKQHRNITFPKYVQLGRRAKIIVITSETIQPA